jgi:t-SNARE complex subunit (syntaxin)
MLFFLNSNTIILKSMWSAFHFNNCTQHFDSMKQDPMIQFLRKRRKKKIMCIMCVYVYIYIYIYNSFFISMNVLLQI